MISDRVCVVGAGLMGRRIAGELSLNGFNVALYDKDKLKLNEAKMLIDNELNQIIPEKIKNYYFSKKGKINYFENFNFLKNSSLIIECINEKLEDKIKLFKEIEEFVDDDVILTTSSLSLQPLHIFQYTKNKKVCLGLRFIFPVYLIPFVEVTITTITSSATLEKIGIFLKKMEKKMLERKNNEVEKFLQLKKEEADELQTEQVERMERKMRKELKKIMNEKKKIELEINNQEILDVSTASPGLRECIICMGRERDTLLRPCGHLITCNSCSWDLLKSSSPCPLCRTPLKEILHVFQS